MAQGAFGVVRGALAECGRGNNRRDQQGRGSKKHPLAQHDGCRSVSTICITDTFLSCHLRKQAQCRKHTSRTYSESRSNTHAHVLSVVSMLVIGSPSHRPPLGRTKHWAVSASMKSGMRCCHRTLIPPRPELARRIQKEGAVSP
jgi:hypothetical protein